MLQGCQSPIAHGLYVWQHYVSECFATKIAIKSHSDGGRVTAALYDKYESDFTQRVYASAYTGDSAVPLPVNEYTKKVRATFSFLWKYFCKITLHKSTSDKIWSNSETYRCLRSPH